MNKLRRKRFSLWFRDNEPPTILQNESSECSIACLAMIATYHGYNINLLTMRRRFSISAKGCTLPDIINIAHDLNLIGRAIKLNLNNISSLKVPCILHWDLNHFVVLVKVKSNSVIIIDPAQGRKNISFIELSNHFTGIALELTKGKDFELRKEKNNLRLLRIFKGIRGLQTNLLVLVLAAFTIEIISLINPFLLQWSIDKVIPTADTDLLVLLLIGFVIVLFFEQIVLFSQSWISLHFNSNLKLELETSVFSKLITLPLDYFQKRHLGDIVSRFKSINNIQSVLTVDFVKALLDGMFAILTLSFMILYSLKLSIIVIVSVILYIGIRLAYYLPLKELLEEKLVLQAKKETFFLETLRGIKAIQFYNKGTQRLSLWYSKYINEMNSDIRIGRLDILFTTSNRFIFGAENLLVIWFGVSYIINSSLTVGSFIAYMAYKNQFKMKLNSLIDSLVKIKLLDVDKSRISDILLTNEIDQNRDNSFDIENVKDNSVKISNLFFSYSKNEPFIFNNFSLEIGNNEFVVITGASGKGKTTLLNLIAGINNPTSGDISIGGCSILKHKLPNSLVSIVSQDDTLYAGTILENICFFDQAANISWIEECSKMANIHNDIISMPMGYDTLVGDMGSTLSGGQKQRLYLARALYFKPKINFSQFF